MRTIIFLGLVMACLVVAGIVHVQKSGDQVQITIDKQKAAQAAGKLLEEGRDIVDDAEAALERASQDSSPAAPATR